LPVPLSPMKHNGSPLRTHSHEAGEIVHSQTASSW
jgi:hypothetical protein